MTFEDSGDVMDAAVDLEEDASSRTWSDSESDDGASSVSSPIDADTDDDGLTDDFELSQGLSPVDADYDDDGLSDGLELGRGAPQLGPVGVWTDPATPLHECSSGAQTYEVRKAWQKFEGSSGFRTNAKDADSDNDGILDGLEDLNHNGVYGDNGELYPIQVGSQSGADYDGDGLLDGLELLLWGQPNRDEDGKLTYTICDIAMPDVWGSSESAWASRMDFDASEPFQTDPRDPNTDKFTAHTQYLDKIPDGQDIHPRGDAAFAIFFDGFRMKDPPDSGSDKWWIDLYVPEIAVTLPILNSEYKVGFGAGANVNFHSKDLAPLDYAVLTELEDPNNVIDDPVGLDDAVWRLAAVSEGNLLRFNIPDSTEGFNLNRPCGSFTVHFKDWDNGPNDDIDLNSGGSSEKTTPHEYCLDDDLRDATASGDYKYLIAQSSAVEHQGKHERFERDEDGLLKLRFGDEVPKFFLENLRRPGMLPAGNCLGESNCL